MIKLFSLIVMYSAMICMVAAYFMGLTDIMILLGFVAILNQNEVNNIE